MAVTLISPKTEPSDPWVSEIVCDKLSLTVKTTGAQEDKSIRAAILNLVDAGYGKLRPRPMYATSAHLFTGNFNESSVLVQCEPKRSGLSGFRAEWSPANAPLSEVRSHLEALFPSGWADLAGRAIVTRIDVTQDLNNIPLDDLLFWASGFQKSSSFCKGGRIETYYIGTATGAFQFCVYDKVAEIKRKNLDRMIKIPVPDHDITRVEVRIRQRIPLIETDQIPNPLTKLSITRVAGIDPTEWETRLFIRAARAEGAQDALLVLPKKARAKFKAVLESAAADLWKPDEAWSGWATVAQALQDPGPPLYSTNVADFLAVSTK